ncbi:MAG: ABC transporter permease, partial [Deltaproteobacteria bacterium]|nr:ABC transporter permease [Deltaproteobacteria bacterium]
SGGATLALLQALLFLCLAPLAHIHLTLWSILALIAILWFLGLSLSALGFCLAWRMDSVQGFHAIMMLILMPLWFLSGAFFPSSGLNWIIKSFMAINPLTYGLSVIRHILYWNSPELLFGLPSFSMSMGVLGLFGTVVLLISWKSVHRS